MSQHDFDIANAGGSAVRGDLNDALEALVSLSSGATAPATTFPYQLWLDTANNILKMRNGANSAWISLALSVTASHETKGQLVVNGSLLIPGALLIAGYGVTGWAFNPRFADSGDYLQLCPSANAVLDATKGLKITRSSGLVEALQGLLVSGADLTLGSGRKLVFADGSSMSAAAKRPIIHRAERTAALTSTATSFTDLTSLSVAITPVSTASTFLILLDLHAIADTSGNGAEVQLVRDSTPIYVGDAASNRVCGSVKVPDYIGMGTADHNFACNAIAYDSPATASAITYKAQGRLVQAGGYLHVNRSAEDTDDANHTRHASSLTVIEFA